MAGFRVLLWFVKWTIILAVAVFGIHFWLSTKGYVFSAQSISTIAQKHNGKR